SNTSESFRRLTDASHSWRERGMHEEATLGRGRRPLTLALLATALYIVLPTHAASSNTNSSPYSQPRWWAKYQVVSEATFKHNSAGKTNSVKVGTNVNVSHEAGPQSETSITINPTNPQQIVAGSNEIFRLPMRGYFSSDGGATWGGVD